MKSKILFVIGRTRSGGAEKRAILTAKLLSNDFETVVFAFRDQKVDGVSYVFKEDNKEYDKCSFREKTLCLSKMIDQEKPDFVISYLSHVSALASFAIKHSHHKPKNIFAICNNKMSLKNMMILRSCGKMCDAIYLQNNYQFKIINFIKAPKIVLANPLFENVSVEHSYEKFSFMSCGRLTNQKNHKFAILAFKQVHNNNPTSTFDIYGNGELKNKLIKLIKKQCLEDCVHIYPYTDDIEEKYKTHNIYLHTSKNEGFPNAVMEAMSKKLVVFTTCFDNISKDLVSNGRGYPISTKCPVQFGKSISDYLTHIGDINEKAYQGSLYIKQLCSASNFVSKMKEFLEGLK